MADPDPRGAAGVAEQRELYASAAFRAAHPNGEPNTPAHAVAHTLGFAYQSARFNPILVAQLKPNGYGFAHPVTDYEPGAFPGAHSHR